MLHQTSTMPEPCDEWLNRWKVTSSINKCRSMPFTLDPKESNGRARLCLSMRGQALPVDPSPTFLGLKLDGHLSFNEHITDLKKRKWQADGSASKPWPASRMAATEGRSKRHT